MQGYHRFFRVVADLNLFSLAYCFGLGLGFGLVEVLVLGTTLAGIAAFSGAFDSYFGASSSFCSLGFSFSGR